MFYLNIFLPGTDVDVPEPDEKSLITYVSSLYDVFPDVPSVEQSLQDNVSTKNKALLTKKKLASSFFEIKKGGILRMYVALIKTSRDYLKF